VIDRVIDLDALYERIKEADLNYVIPFPRTPGNSSFCAIHIVHVFNGSGFNVNLNQTTAS